MNPLKQSRISWGTHLGEDKEIGGRMESRGSGGGRFGRELLDKFTIRKKHSVVSMW